VAVRPSLNVWAGCTFSSNAFINVTRQKLLRCLFGKFDSLLLNPFIADSSACLELLEGHGERHWYLLQIRFCQRYGCRYMSISGKQPNQRFDTTNQATTPKDEAFHAVLNGQRCWSCHRAHQNGKLCCFEAPRECASICDFSVMLCEFVLNVVTKKAFLVFSTVTWRNRFSTLLVAPL